MPHQRYNHHHFAAIIFLIIISTFAVVEAFSYQVGGITTICKSTHDVHKLLSIHHHRPLFATTRRDDESTQQSKSIFDQFKMPWDNSDDNTDDGGVSWPINNEKSTSTTPQSRSSVVDGYVETAKDVLSSIQDDYQQPSPNDIQQSQTKLGILLIDHGSKRQASNDHLQSIAKKFC